MLKKLFQPKYRYRKEGEWICVYRRTMWLWWVLDKCCSTEDQAQTYINKQIAAYWEPWTYYP